MALKNQAGYGRFWTNGHAVLAHRAAYELTYGPVPHELEVCHTCDVPACVRLDHLWLGTHADNMNDAATKARMPRGLRKPGAKLSDKDVRAIRERYATGLVSQRALAAEYGVCQQLVSNIVAMKSRVHA
ncbi:MAG: HNH endonuclease [Dehalococcoidia bacterium]